MIKKLGILLVLLLSFAQAGRAQGAIDYTGKRIHFSSAKVQSDSKKTLKISLVVSNTGRKDVRLYEEMNIDKVVFAFGDSFDDERIIPYKAKIIAYLLKKNTTLRVGQLFTPKAFKIRKNTPDPEFSRRSMDDVVSVLPDVEDTNIEAPQNVPEEKKPEVTKPSPATPEYTENKKPKILNPIGELPRPEAPKQVLDDEAPEGKTRILNPIGELPRPEAAPDACFDLVITNMVITKQTKRNIYVSFDLINKGEGTFRFNRKDDACDNLSIKAFFASIPRLTRGSLIAGGTHFSDIFDPKKFELGLGESIEGEMKISLELMTKFTPVVLLELDPFSVVTECDKVNNVASVVLKE